MTRPQVMDDSVRLRRGRMLLGLVAKPTMMHPNQEEDRMATQDKCCTIVPYFKVHGRPA